MNILKITAFLCLFLTFSSKIDAQSTNPTLSACNGQQYLCITGNTYELCVNINVNPAFGPIDHFTIKWGDGSPLTTVPGNGTNAPPQQKHNYNLSNFYGTCMPSTEYTLKLLAYKVSGDSTNSSFSAEFKNPPIANFDFSPQIGCVGEVVTFIDKSCLHSPSKMKQWNYGDNTGNTTMTTHTYTVPGTYNVKLKVENECSSNEKVKPITIVDKPKAIIRADSGFLMPSAILKDKDTAKLCLSYGGGVKFKGDESLNENNYKWELTPTSGWTQNFPFLDYLSFWRIAFSEEKVYKLKLTVANECLKKDTSMIYVKVVKALGLKLNHQVDTCQSISYKPVPYFDKAKYYIDGVLVSSFPTNLPIKATKYKIEAKFSNECGIEIAKDSFFVKGFLSAKILTPSKDTIICQSNTPIKLKPELAGGTFSGTPSPLINGNNFTPSTVGNYTITYTIGKGTCENKSSVKINVVKEIDVTLPAQEDVCNTLIYKPQNYNSLITYKINGGVVSTFPTNLVISPNPYIVTAEYNGLCGNQFKTDTFYVKEVPSSMILFPGKDTTICESNIPYALKPKVTGGVFSGAPSIVGNDFTPSAAGDYTITYTIGTGTCKNESSVKIKVVKEIDVTLPAQEDVCNTLIYKPKNYNSLITYKINGSVASTFPTNLVISPNPYIVTAEYNGLCGNQFKTDTFYVKEVPSSMILFPSKDTTICESNIPYVLKPKITGGIFSGAPSINSNNFTPSAAGDYTITYTIGTGTCENKSSVKIKVVKEIDVTLPAQKDVCNTLNYKPQNYNSLITYKINSSVVSTFPTNLVISPNPYIVTAEYKGLCGNQFKTDTFYVKEIPSSTILFPSKDTLICESSIPYILKPKVIGGSFSGTTLISGNNFTPSTAGDYIIIYTIELFGNSFFVTLHLLFNDYKLKCDIVYGF